MLQRQVQVKLLTPYLATKSKAMQSISSFGFVSFRIIRVSKYKSQFDTKQGFLTCKSYQKYMQNKKNSVGNPCIITTGHTIILYPNYPNYSEKISQHTGQKSVLVLGFRCLIYSDIRKQYKNIALYSNLKTREIISDHI